MAFNKCLDFTDDAELEMKAMKFGNPAFWAFNLPVQIFLPTDTENEGYTDGSILLYMPRKETCCSLSFEEFFENVEGGASKENIKALCDVSAAILRNLAKNIEEVGNQTRPNVYYPNDK